MPLYKLQSYLGMTLTMSEECRHMSNWWQVKLENHTKAFYKANLPVTAPTKKSGI